MKLIDYKENDLWRGTILRFRGKYPFEEIVGFMLVDIPYIERSIFVNWLINNWNA